MSAVLDTPFVWGSKRLKSKKTDVWAHNFDIALHAAEKSLLTLSSLVETEENATAPNTNPDDNPETDASLKAVTQTAVHNCLALITIIRQPSHGIIKLPVGSVFNLISRGLKLSYPASKTLPFCCVLSEALPAIYQAMLHLVNQLIICCGTHLLPQVPLITDLCLQVLINTTYMKTKIKNIIRTSTYNVLKLLIEMFGWGQFLINQYNFLYNQLILDIKFVDTLEKEEKQISANFENKKSTTNSYSNLLNINQKEIENSIKDHSLSELKSTVAALEVSRLVLDNADFILAENLARCILDTTSTLQRSAAPSFSPYAQQHCRKLLYSTVLACATINSVHGQNKKDAIAHYRLMNNALNVLSCGMHLDTSYEIQLTCKKALKVLFLSSHMNKPIIQKTFMNEKNNGNDNSHEIDNAADLIDNENQELSKQVLEAKVIVQNQNHQIIRLKQEIQALKTLQEEALQQTRLNNDTAHQLNNDTAHLQVKSSPIVENICVTKQIFSQNIPKKRKDDVNVLKKENPTKKSHKESLEVENEIIKPTSGGGQSSVIEAMILDFVDAEPDMF
ncbi:uncharacterized protein LOC131946735 [Physella acuta]|uniref:uncharacterized protein LOC131946735 n=1 Tax=Physella acuta TaxID=109671 RepID=UPI0027DC9128|nr:uncharacterized protein LOC131946735 [Physella acuta]